MSDRGQPSGWRRLVPISFWLTSYEKGFLVPDLVAALTVWALVVPEAMAYASLAGMPPETGLYAALVAPLAYAIFGTSRQLNVGPSSTVAVLSASIIAPLAASGDPELFVELTTALAIRSMQLDQRRWITRRTFGESPHHVCDDWVARDPV